MRTEGCAWGSVTWMTVRQSPAKGELYHVHVNLGTFPKRHMTAEARLMVVVHLVWLTGSTDNKHPRLPNAHEGFFVVV